MVSVIILNWNSKETIIDCIQSVIDQTYKNIEIIIIDNNSRDGSWPLIESTFKKKCKLIKNDKNVGFACGQNIGIDNSSGDYILSLNSDAVLDQDYIKEIVNVLEDDQTLGWATGKLLRMLNGKQTKIIDSTGHFLTSNWYVHNRGAEEIDNGQFNVLEAVFGACAAAAIYKKEALDAVKFQNEYFDEDFFSYFEDADLDWRLQLCGWKCVYVPNAVAYHARGMTNAKKNPAIQVHYLKNRYLMALKNDLPLRVIKNSLMIFIAEFYCVFFKENFSIFAWIKAGKNVIKLCPRFFLKRKMIQQARCVSGRYMNRWFLNLFLLQNKNKLRKKNNFSFGCCYNILYTMNSAEIAGSEKALILLLRRLNRKKFNPIVMCPAQGPLIKRLRKENVRVLVNIQKSRFGLSTLYNLVQILKRENIDLVHLHSTRVHAIIAKLLRIPVVERINMTRHKYIWSFSKFVFIDRLMSCFVDRFIIVSEALKRDMIKRKISKRKLLTIYNGIDWNELTEPSEIIKTKRELSLSDDDIVIGVIGRLVKQKGHKYFIEAAVSILEKFPKAKFLIVGNGPLEKDLKSFVKKAGIDNNVIFTGFRNDIANLLEIMDIFVLPSIWEPLSNALLEAMAIGKPIVATNVDGTAEALNHNYSGLLIKPEDSSEIAKAVVKLLENKEKALKMGMAAKEVVKARFCLEGMAKRTEDVYLDLLTGNLLRSRLKKEINSCS
ncbi:MAG: glycosyltransferase [Candidatus Omnitrophica bacterium]|nr:glycosyltransferase [Candidatus Omnitrophota bacterium]